MFAHKGSWLSPDTAAANFCICGEFTDAGSAATLYISVVKVYKFARPKLYNLPFL